MESPAGDRWKERCRISGPEWLEESSGQRSQDGWQESRMKLRPPRAGTPPGSRSALPESGRRTSTAASFPARSLRRPLVFCIDPDLALECSNSLDDFRHALQRKHDEAGRYYEFDRPTDQAAGVARHFVDGVSL